MKKPLYLYLEYFNLKEAPFKITPTTEFFYGGGQRGEILHALLYALNVGEGIVMLTGEVGSGKTMMMRRMIEQLDDDTEVIYIANPSLSGREILYHICEELKLKAEESRFDTVRLLQNYLIDQYAKKRRVVAFIDEAQAMPDESLEEIRLLSNLETSRDKLLQIFLFGQPEFEEKISQQSMRQLRERMSVKLKLKPFGRDDVREYIATRLRAAGYNGKPMFSPAACHLIAVVSQGLSRRINVLADKALLSAYERNKLSVSFSDARRAVKDVNFGRMRYRTERARRISRQVTMALAASACMLLVVAVGIRLSTEPAVITAFTGTSTEVSVPEALDKTITIATQQVVEEAFEEDKFAEDESVKNIVEAAADEQGVQPVSLAVAPAKALQAAVQALNSGKEVLDGDVLAAELESSAEQQEAAPQIGGGGAEWQEAARINLDAVQNTRWDWMPASSYLRNRLNTTQIWLLGEEKINFHTARLMTVGQSRAVFLEKFIRYFSDFYPIRNLMVYPARLQSGEVFVVTYGVYQNRNDAEVFIANLPYYFTGGRPYAQTLRESASQSADEWQTTQ